MVRAGLEGKAVPVLPAGDDLHVVDDDVPGRIGVQVPAVGIDDADSLHPAVL